jgi:hypothetical protein
MHWTARANVQHTAIKQMMEVSAEEHDRPRIRDVRLAIQTHRCLTGKYCSSARRHDATRDPLRDILTAMTGVIGRSS